MFILETITNDDPSVYQTLIQAGTSVLASVITLLGGFAIYGPKLRAEQKSDFQKTVGEKKADALIDFKKIIHECESFDVLEDNIYELDEVVLGVKEINSAIYPGFLEDQETFFSFIDKVKELRDKEMFLNQEAAAYLIYLYKYLYELLNYSALYYPHVEFPLIGAIIIPDIHSWAYEADAIIIKDINEAKTNIESHKGAKWEKKREAIYSLLYDKSVLKLLQTDPNQLTSEEREKYKLAKEILDDREKYNTQIENKGKRLRRRSH